MLKFIQIFFITTLVTSGEGGLNTTFPINALEDAVGTFFPIYGLSLGLSLTTIGLLRGAKSLTAIGIRPVSGYFFKFINYRLLSNISILVWSVMVLLFPAMRLPWIFLAAFIIMGLCRGLIRVTSATMVAEEKEKSPDGLGFASGFYNAGLDLGAFAGPAIAGVLVSHLGITGMFRVIPLGLLAVYCLASILVKKSERRIAIASV